MLTPRPTTFYLGWDPGHFYLAYRTYLRPGYKPSILDGRSPGHWPQFSMTRRNW